MKTCLSVVLILHLLPTLSIAQNPVESKMYAWKSPIAIDRGFVHFTNLFEGSAHDMAYISMDAASITPSRKVTNRQVPADEEHLLLMKSGTVKLSINDSTWIIGAGSVALLLPGQKYGLHNATVDSCTYFVLKYRSKPAMDKSRGLKEGGSFVKDWNKIAFKPHDKGGIRNYFERSTAMTKRFEMHVTTLKQGIRSHDPHTHRAEEIVLVIEGNTEMQIDDKFYKGAAGDLYYLGSNKSHAIRNIGNGACTYFAFQFE